MPQPNKTPSTHNVLRTPLFDDGVKPPESIDDATAILTAKDAPFIREALGRAAAARTLGTDPGDAYMQGILDGLAFRHMQALDLTGLADIETGLANELHTDT